MINMIKDEFYFSFFLFFHNYEIQEHDILPSMKKSLKDMSIEKDAAIVARVHLPKH